jgi:ArsR family transcriptional regulator
MTSAGFEAVARTFRLLADPLRLRILYALRSGRARVGEIARQLDCSQPTASRHLAKLSEGGILERTRIGATVFYAVRDPRIYGLCERICGDVGRRRAPLFTDDPSLNVDERLD